MGRVKAGSIVAVSDGSTDFTSVVGRGVLVCVGVTVAVCVTAGVVTAADGAAVGDIMVAGVSVVVVHDISSSAVNTRKTVIFTMIRV